MVRNTETKRCQLLGLMDNYNRKDFSDFLITDVQYKIMERGNCVSKSVFLKLV
jgi:hypothetical protein